MAHQIKIHALVFDLATYTFPDAKYHTHRRRGVII